MHITCMFNHKNTYLEFNAVTWHSYSAIVWNSNPELLSFGKHATTQSAFFHLEQQYLSTTKLFSSPHFSKSDLWIQMMW